MLFKGLFPLVSIGRPMLKVVGKCFSLLWQIYLMVGPHYKLLEEFTSCVVSMTVDFGTEKSLPGIADLLPSFCLYIGVPLPKGCRKRTKTFPRAIVAPGWHHTWDGLVRRGLTSTEWFPVFLRQAKGVWSFFRHHLPEMEDELVRKGHRMVAQIFKSIELENFAKWRWNTLKKVVCELVKVYATFKVWYPTFEFVAGLRDASEAQLLKDTLASKSFVDQLKYTCWLTSWMGDIDKWGGGCPCCAPGENPDCRFKGRRLMEAFSHLECECNAAILEAESWGPSDFPGSPPDFVHSCVGQSAV